MLQYNNKKVKFHKGECYQCGLCGWRCEYMESHIEHAYSFYKRDVGCAYINSKYNVKIDEDGEIIDTLKKNDS